MVFTKLLAITGKLTPVFAEFPAVGSHLVSIAGAAVTAQLATILPQVNFVAMEFPAVSPKLSPFLTEISPGAPQLASLALPLQTITGCGRPLGVRSGAFNGGS